MGMIPIAIASPVAFFSVVAILFAVYVGWPRKQAPIYFPLGFWRKRLKFGNTKWIVAGFIVGVSLILGFAFARPYQGSTKELPVEYQKPVMLIVDVSGSMDGDSYEKSLGLFRKISAHKLNASLGVMLYSDQPYIARDFTPNASFLEDTLDNQKEVQDISSGTETDKALDLARAHFAGTEDIPLERTVVIISDFNDTLQDVAEAINTLLDDNINVFGFVIEKDQKTAADRINTVQSMLYGGSTAMVGFVNANDESGVQNVLREIEEMDGVITIKNETAVKKDILWLPLSVCGLLLVVILILSETKLRKIP